jgi:hypothetical protein
MSRARLRKGGRIALPIIIGGSLVPIQPSSGQINTGSETGGNFNNIKKCDNDATWDIEEVGGTVEIELTFNVVGNAKKVKVNGKSSNNNTYILRAYNGATWDDIGSINATTDPASFLFSLSPTYTIAGEVKLRIYRTTGGGEKIYLNCVIVYAQTAPPPSPISPWTVGTSVVGGADTIS